VAEVTIRELRNKGGDVVDRVVRGERLTVTRDGRPVAELHPIRQDGVDGGTLLRRWQHLPPVDSAELRADLGSVIESGL